MAEIARSYHEKAQTDTDPPQEGEREKAIQEVLGQIDRKLSDEQNLKLSENLTYEDISEALKLMPNGKAPGLDGIPTELWKTLNKEYISQNKRRQAPGSQPPFDVIALIKAAFNDVEENGVHPEVGFTE
ncbi:hypothetical protein DFP72DRAFT_780681, partial [Ephemerocybe angulata]